MASKWLTTGAALLLGLAVVSDARAGDKFTVYLEDAASISTKGLTGGNALTTTDIDDDESADATEYVSRGGGGRGGFGGGRGGWGGGRGWGGGGWGGRGWGGYGYGRGFGYGYGGGWGWGRGWGWGWGGWGWPYYYAGPSYYYYNPYPSPYYYYYSYAPMTVEVATSAPTSVASAQIRGNSATYPYNGGPNNPVPFPQGGPDFNPPAPRLNPPDTIALTTTPAKKYTYPAYGETPTRTTAAR